jgi:hypothetical protein
VLVRNQTIVNWFTYLIFADDFFDGFEEVESKGFWHWCERFPSNRMRTFIRVKFGNLKEALESFCDWKGCSLLDLNMDYWEDMFKFSRRESIDDYDDRPVNYKIMAKHDEYTVGAKTAKGPRPVCIPATHYLVRLGPWCLAIGEEMKRVWNANSRIVYTAGMTLDQISDILKQHELWYCGDFSGYDASIQWFGIATQLYFAKRLVKDEAARKLFDKTMESRIRTLYWKYTTVGKMKSGHPGTSCLNTILTAWIFYLACRFAGITDFKLLVSGDDTAIAMNPESFMRFEQELMLICNSIGLNIKGSVKDISMVDYNSQVMYPVKGPQEWMLGPKIIRGSKRLVYSLDSPCEFKNHVQSLALAESLNLNYVPVLRDSLRKIIEQYGIAKQVDPWLARRIKHRKEASRVYELDEDRWRWVSANRFCVVVKDWGDVEFIKIEELENDAMPDVYKYGPDECYDIILP